MTFRYRAIRWFQHHAYRWLNSMGNRHHDYVQFRITASENSKLLAAAFNRLGELSGDEKTEELRDRLARAMRED